MTKKLFKFIDRFIPAKHPYLCHECAKPLHLDVEIFHGFCDDCCKTCPTTKQATVKRVV